MPGSARSRSSRVLPAGPLPGFRRQADCATRSPKASVPDRRPWQHPLPSENEGDACLKKLGIRHVLFLTKPLGAPAGLIETYIEVPFVLNDRSLRPDGLIRVSRGAMSWTALVEVKTGNNDLQTEQLENYLDIARVEGYDAVVTISNEIPAIAGTHPTRVDGRKLRSVRLHHISWSEVLCLAVLQKEHRGVADPDQAWILGELIRYLEHPKSGALDFRDMSESWVIVRDSVTAGTLRAADKGLPEIANRWDALLRFTSLQLGRQLGDEVSPILSRKEIADPSLRAQSVMSELLDSGCLSGAIRVPNIVSHLVIAADLRTGTVTVHMDIPAPAAGRTATRVRWLTRQLKSTHLTPSGSRPRRSLRAGVAPRNS